MEEEKKPEVFTGLDATAQARLEKLHFQRELRGLELKAYSGVLEALRASGKPNTEKEGIIKTLRDFFNVSEDRHKAELRLLAYDEKLSLISQKLTGYDFADEWASNAQKIYVPLGQQPFSIFRSFPTSFTRSCTTYRDPIPIRTDKTKYNEDSDVHSEGELDLIDSIIRDNPVCNGWPPEKQRPVTIAVEPGTGNEEEIEEIEQHIKKRLKLNKKQQSFTPAKSPDITDTPRISNKSANLKGENKPSSTAKSRGVKRKESEEFMTPPIENDIIALPKKLSDHPKSRHKIKRSNRTPPKMKASRRPPIPPAETKKSKESSEETSSADEGENGPLPLEESSRVMSPVFSEVIRSSVMSRGRGPRGRAGVDRRKNNTLTSPSKLKTGKARPRTPNQKSGKFKNSVPTSGSRRKSKLNEKLDYDDVLMDLDGNEMEKQAVYATNTDEPPSRRLLLDSQSFDRMGDSRVVYKDFRSSEDCAIYAESLPINYNHEDMEQVTDGVFKRPLPPSRGPKLWEIKDARLTHREDPVSDENNSSTVHYGEIEIQHQQHTPPDMSVIQANSVNDNIGSTTPTKHELAPPSKKQRIKSPLIVNPNINPPNVSKVPIPAPVFSTSLSSVNKKRQNKPISVVDSLNLHLPTSATASSLAASSNNRRPGTATGGGCSMFSNSSALIAGARGTAPGILQQQRKAQPHILSNSKVHRAFIPSMNAGSSASNSVNSNLLSPISATSTFTAGITVPSNNLVATGGGAAASHTVQIPPSPIPISAISTGPPSSTPLPFQSFPSSNSPSISLGSSAGVPIGHVNRSPTGPNIIFVQKSNGPSTVPPVPSNVVPLKTPPRAVILRRTQLPRQQGNVMILDVQKNQIVSPGQTSPFLQTARILNAPGELSLLNIQPSSSPRKSSPTSTVGSSSPSLSASDSPVQTIMSPPQLQKTDGIVLQAASQESFIANLSATINQLNNSVVSSPVIYQNQHQQQSVVTTEQLDKEDTEPNDTDQAESNVPPDAEYAQIEAELMQMEEGGFEEVVYEEEVTTEIVPLEDGENTQYIYTNDTCASTEDENIIVTQEVSSHNASTISGSSTDTASENETTTHLVGSPDIDNSSRQTLTKKVSLSPVEEVKIASDAISRALALNQSSSSPTKRLTFSVPITLGAATFSLTTSGGKTNAASECITVSANSGDSDINVVPTVFHASSAELTSPVAVVEEDSSSTNNVHIANSATTIEVAVNDVLQHSQPQTQENANAS